MKSSRGYENSFHIREEIQGAHGGRSGFKKRTRDTAESQRPLMKLMLGKWHIKETAQMTFCPDVSTLFELRLRKFKGQGISPLAFSCRARHLIWERNHICRF